MCQTITPFCCSVFLKDSNSSVLDEDDYEDSQAASELQGVKLLLGRFICATDALDLQLFLQNLQWNALPLSEPVDPVSGVILS